MLRPFTPDIIAEVKREIAFIWAAHRVHKLNGKMRIYSMRNQDIWQSHDPGFELWFGPSEIDEAMKKLALYYREAKPPNTSFLLDPMVYEIVPGSAPKPLGSGFVWGMAIGDDLTEEDFERLKKLGVFVSPIFEENAGRVGVKVIAFTQAINTPVEKYSPDGTAVTGVKEISELLQVSEGELIHKQYLLSGLIYEHSNGSVYQHPAFHLMFDNKPMVSMDHIQTNSIHLKGIKDSALCWNAYGRDPAIYNRYGVDAMNLTRNLKAKAKAEAAVQLMKRELALVWDANLRFDLTGEMRMFSCPDQQSWRAKLEGFELWFTPENIEEAAIIIERHYNGGVLPNTPLLLDPVVYRQETNDKGETIRVPHGTGIAWSTAMCVGLEDYNEETGERLDDMKLITGNIIRAGTDDSGRKVLAFLDEPYLFDDENKEEFRKMLIELNDTDKEEDVDDGLDLPEELRYQLEMAQKEEEAEDRRKAGKPTKEEEEAAAAAEKKPEEDLGPIGHAAWSAPCCQALFDISGVNGEQYQDYYMVSGMEYLCSNGAFENPELNIEMPGTAEERKEVIEKYTISLQAILDAHKCWVSYDKLHPLWTRFGIDASQLEKNLRYYNLCGRDFELLSMTGASLEEDTDDKTFEFLVPGIIPKSSVTIFAGTNGSGKSTILHQLITIIGSDWPDDGPKPTWLGSEIDHKQCSGMNVYFSGEDSEAIVQSRQKNFDPDGRCTRVLLKCGNDFGIQDDGSDNSIRNFLERLKTLPEVSLVVIDSARKFLTADEEDAEPVIELLDAAERFAQEKECAVIIAHHLRKGSKPKDCRDIPEMLRGNEAFSDLPSAVISMLQEESNVVVGVAKSSIPPDLGILQGERVFVRDLENLSLIWLPGDKGVRSFNVSADELEAIKASQS